MTCHLSCRIFPRPSTAYSATNYTSTSLPCEPLFSPVSHSPHLTSPPLCFYVFANAWPFNVLGYSDVQRHPLCGGQGCRELPRGKRCGSCTGLPCGASLRKVRTANESITDGRTDGLPDGRALHYLPTRFSTQNKQLCSPPFSFFAHHGTRSGARIKITSKLNRSTGCVRAIPNLGDVDDLSHQHYARSSWCYAISPSLVSCATIWPRQRPPGNL